MLPPQRARATRRPITDHDYAGTQTTPVDQRRSVLHLERSTPARLEPIGGSTARKPLGSRLIVAHRCPPTSLRPVVRWSVMRHGRRRSELCVWAYGLAASSVGLPNMHSLRRLGVDAPTGRLAYLPAGVSAPDPGAFLSDVLTGRRRAQFAKNFCTDAARRRAASVLRMTEFVGLIRGNGRQLTPMITWDISGAYGRRVRYPERDEPYDPARPSGASAMATTLE